MMGSRSLQLKPACFTLFLATSLLAGCGENEAPDDKLQAVKAPEIVRIMPAEEALAGAHVPTLDPATMNEAQIRKALEPGPRCDFRYTSSGKPVLAISMAPGGAASGGVVKVNGHLITLEPAPEAAASEGSKHILMRADPIRITVTPDEAGEAVERENVRRREATTIFEVGQSLSVRYLGYLDCTPEPPTKSPRR